jgi:hypothetical protein
MTSIKTRTLTTPLVGLAVAALAGLGLAGTASAATAATAPSCIEVASQGGSVGTTLFVTVANNCSREYRVTVVVNRAPDSSCFSIAPGDRQGLKFAGAEPTVASVDLC